MIFMNEQFIKNKLSFTDIVSQVKLQSRKLLSTISPTLASKMLYKRAFGKKLDLNNPTTLNEKVMWLKLNTYYKNPLVTQCADKYAVRDYVKSCGCEEILNDQIAVWDSVDEIDWDLLPNKFVIKCNHGCGYNIICHDKSNFNIDEAEKKLREWMKEDFWKLSAEVNYKYIKKKIICEKYIETEDGVLPTDYKFYCFDGKADCVMVCVGREAGKPKFYYFNREWELLKYSKDSLKIPADFNITKPKGIDEAFKYADKLSTPFPFVRTDLYLVNGKTIFGELTFTPSGGLDTKRLPDTDLLFGEILTLPKSK